ncbi:MAG: hypothetical protein ACRDHZ_04895 [Ktedonobacteraceae bacterium]
MQPRFAREQFFPKGWEFCLSQFLELFHRYGYIYRPFNSDTWLSANEQWKLTDTEIIKAISCAHDKFCIGARAGKATRYAVLDIDAKSKYHNKAQLDKLLNVLSRAGLSRSSLYRSSFSGGWHLYLFFDEPINSADLYRQLVALLTLSDFKISKGQLEVFPNPGKASMGMGLRLPLQHGWAWLDKKTLEVDYERYEISATKALEFFLDVLESDANSYKDFRQLKARVQDLETRRSAAATLASTDRPNNVVQLKRTEKNLPASEFSALVVSIFGHLPQGMNAEDWCKGRTFHLEGLSGPSQRAEAIFCLGHYFFYGDPSRELPALGYGCEEERKWAIKEFLDARHNGCSKDLTRGRADATAQVDRAANWRPAHKQATETKAYSPTRPISWVRENANRKTDARKRIAEALDGLNKLGRSFTTVELQQAAGCSRETLYNHADIWRRDYEDLASGFFAICTDEYNAVEGAASQESLPPSTVQEKITPQGLLAARRVVYEISMRSKRDIQRKQKTTLESLDSSEKDWWGNVTRLTESEPSSLTVPELKALLTVLVTYLALAPSEECQIFVQARINRIKQTLADAAGKPLSLVRPP